MSSIQSSDKETKDLNKKLKAPNLSYADALALYLEILRSKKADTYTHNTMISIAAKHEKGDDAFKIYAYMLSNGIADAFSHTSAMMAAINCPQPNPERVEYAYSCAKKANQATTPVLRMLLTAAVLLENLALAKTAFDHLLSISPADQHDSLKAFYSLLLKNYSPRSICEENPHRYPTAGRLFSTPRPPVQTTLENTPDTQCSLGIN